MKLIDGTQPLRIRKIHSENKEAHSVEEALGKSILQLRTMEEQDHKRQDISKLAANEVIIPFTAEIDEGRHTHRCST